MFTLGSHFNSIKLLKQGYSNPNPETAAPTLHLVILYDHRLPGELAPAFNSHIERYREFTDYNVTTEASFIATLREEFLQNNIYSEDVKFNEDYTKIIATRYIIQSQNGIGSAETKEMLIRLRDVANSMKHFRVTLYHSWFNIVEQNLLIPKLTVTLTSLIAEILMLVVIVFIPNLICSLCVFFTIASIELGVLGFMSLWGVNLDMISVLTLIMCIGFSVDFAAHVCYTYVTSDGTPEDRIQKTMYALGLPIIQGATSTVTAVILLATVPSYTLQTFFKIIFLVMVFATWHGLFFLPVLLLLIKPEQIMNSCCAKKSDSIDIPL